MRVKLAPAGRAVLAVVLVAGGLVAVSITGGGMVNAQEEQNGENGGTTQIAFVKEGVINLIDPDGEDPATPLEDAEDVAVQGNFPVLDPAGERIAFESGDDITIMSLVDDEAQDVTIENAAHPTWSPDGTKMAFVREDDDEEHVFVAKDDGTEEQNLTQEPDGGTDTGNNREPAWSSAGTIVFFSDRDDAEADPAVEPDPGLYTVDPANNPDDHTPEFSLTLDAEAAAAPEWSPNGEMVAFNDEDGISVIKAGEGTDQTRAPATADGSHPAWSPEGDEMAFVRAGNLFRKPVDPVDGTGEEGTAAAVDEDEETTAAEPSWGVKAADGDGNGDGNGNGGGGNGGGDGGGDGSGDGGGDNTTTTTAADGGPTVAGTTPPADAVGGNPRFTG